MKNISVPTNDTMIYAVHGNTVDECIANCAKLMAYLTSEAHGNTVDECIANCEKLMAYLPSEAQPENAVDDDEEYDDGDIMDDDVWHEKIMNLINVEKIENETKDV